MCGLHRFPHDLVELGGEGIKDLCHHDAIQSSPIDGWIGNIGKDAVIQGIAMKREKHEVTPPLVVGQQGFQNNHDHRSYVLEAGSLRVQVRNEGGVGFGATVDVAIVVIILGDHDPLGNDKLLFQVTVDGLLLPSKGGSTLTHPSLVQGHACGSHSDNKSLLLSVHGSGGGLSCGRSVILLPHGGGGNNLLLVDGVVGGATLHDPQDGGG
jgi:hypothetical protein